MRKETKSMIMEAVTLLIETFDSIHDRSYNHIEEAITKCQTFVVQAEGLALANLDLPWHIERDWLLALDDNQQLPKEVSWGAWKCAMLKVWSIGRRAKTMLCVLGPSEQKIWELSTARIWAGKMVRVASDDWDKQEKQRIETLKRESCADDESRGQKG